MQWLVALFAILAAFPVEAQPFPAEGTPVIAKTDFGRIEGIVRRRTADSLWIMDRDARLRAMPRWTVQEISTYGTQRGRGAKQGAIVGAILGVATAGTAIWLDTHAKSECICVPISVVAVPAGLIGMPLIGAGLGTLFAPEGWSKPRMY